MLSQPRSVCVVLAAAAWAATAAAVTAGGDLGRGAAIEIVFAASMATAALSEALLSPVLSTAGRAALSDPIPARAAGRHNWPGAVAVIAVLLGPAAGAAFGAGWRTSLFTTVALACAAASIVAYRPGRLLPRGARRTRDQVATADPGQHPGSDLASTRQFVTM
jgi:hypothetical protein